MTHTPGLRHRLRKLAALSWADRLLHIQVVFLLGIAWLALRVVPFRHLARRLGARHVETSSDVSPEHLSEAKRISLAVARISHHTPWNSNCFPQALAAQYLLRRRKIPSTLYLGVSLGKADQEAPRKMTAHAWLRCGSFMVTGGAEHAQYTVTLCFGNA